MPESAPSNESLRQLFHDISSELFLIRGYGELTLDNDALPESVRTNLSKMVERTDEIQRLMEAFRDGEAETGEPPAKPQ